MHVNESSLDPSRFCIGGEEALPSLIRMQHIAFLKKDLAPSANRLNAIGSELTWRAPMLRAQTSLAERGFARALSV